MDSAIKEPEISEEKIRKLVEEVVRRELGYSRYQRVDLLERIVKVEEAIKFLQEEIKQLREDMNKRFEQVDKRFESMEKRFESMERAMSRMFQFMTPGFSVIVVLISLYKFLR